MKGHCRDLWEQEISYLANKEVRGLAQPHA